MKELTMAGDLIVMAVIVILITTLLLIAIKVLSNSRSRDINDGGGGGGGDVPIIPDTSSSSSSSGSWKYDVFLSFRGADTRKTFVDHLYSALQQHGIITYKDDVTLDRGDTIGPSLLKAIQQSKIAIIVFSEKYADSSWCLDELSHIMECKKKEKGQIVMPIFYNVDPSDVRKQKGKFGKSFAKHNNKKKVESWKQALVDASNIAGWEPKYVANGHEAKCIQEIVASIFGKLSSLNPVLDNGDLVGMETRLKDLKQLLTVGSGGVRMVGIWGIGGGGKTTLANSIYKQVSADFDGCCFLGNVREEFQRHGLQSLQEKILLAFFHRKIEVQSVDTGKHKIKSMLCRRNVLFVLDDVDELEELEALAGWHDWFGDGSRIIITTRNEQVLISHRVDDVYPISLLSRVEAIRLLRRHAYHADKPVQDYDRLSLRVISYVNGLPLALKVLGSFLYGKDKNEWMSALDKLKHIPYSKVTDQLKISYDGLDDVEKELFLDIACFHRGTKEDDAMEILDACGFHSAIGLKVLKQKALITVTSRGEFDMHDLIQEMAHHIVRGEYPNNPEKHSRLWQTQDIEDICSRNATMENDKIEAIQLKLYDGSSNLVMLFSNMKKLRFLSLRVKTKFKKGPSFLSNELRYLEWECIAASPFPGSFQPKKLVSLKMVATLQKKLWKGYKYLPCLKELVLKDMKALVRTPDFDGLPCLQKLILNECDSLEEIHKSLGNHSSLVSVNVEYCDKLTRFPSIVGMEKLKILKIEYCPELVEFPKIEAKMDKLVELSLKYSGTEFQPSLVTNLVSLALRWCGKLKSLEGKFLQALTKLNLSDCRLKDGDIQRCEIGELSNLQELNLSWNDFTRLDISLSRLTRLKLLGLSYCSNLVELPELPSSLAILRANECWSLEGVIRDEIHTNCKCLSQVEITGKMFGEKKNFIGWERLLETMLQGNGVESRCMSLHVSGFKIARGFEPRLVKGRRCRMQLPENWFNDYSGFVFCTASNEYPYFGTTISMKHSEENGGWMEMGDSHHDPYSEFLFCTTSNEYSYNGMKISMEHSEENGGWMRMGDSHHDGDVYWEDDNDDAYMEFTRVGYIPFSLLRHTLWWDPTSTAAIHMEIHHYNIKRYGFMLVPKGGGAESSSSAQMETTKTTHSSSSSDEIYADNSDHYNFKFTILHDSKSEFKFQFDHTAYGQS